MIANRGRGRMIGSSSFGAAVDYITREGEHERDHEPPLAIWSEGVSSLDAAAFEMQATASQSKAQDPLYHLIISWDEGECPTYEQAREALDTQFKHLGLEGLQYVAALQNDGLGRKYHVHAVVNRVDPRTHTAREVWQDFEKMREACRETEREQGWREVETPEREHLSRGARDAEYYERKRSFTRRVREEIGPAVRMRLAEVGTWEELHETCRLHGVRYEEVRRGESRGGRIVGPEQGEFARARDMGEDLTHRALEERLGPYQHRVHERSNKDLSFEERCDVAAAEVAKLRASARDAEKGWGSVHEV
jgi:hypothetical protein